MTTHILAAPTCAAAAAAIACVGASERRRAPLLRRGRGVRLREEEVSGTGCAHCQLCLR